MTSIDLDGIGVALEEFRETLIAKGWTIDDLTWRDAADEGWPYPLKARSKTRDPDSVGLRGTNGAFEFKIVVWAGGWANLDAADFRRGEIQSTAPAIEGVEALDVVLRDLADYLRDRE